MKPIIPILISCIFPFMAVSQSISGKIFDSTSHHPVGMVTVSLLRQDSTAVKVTISDSLGYYRIDNISQGSYFIKYSIVGYIVQYSSAIFINDSSTIRLPDLLIHHDPNQLKAVTVYGRRPVIENKNDGIIYNAANDIAISGGSASDLLKRIPMISVDQNGNPSIVGKMSIRVFIDNKPSDIYGSSVADALKTIPAEQIDKVEVITSPSAKYEAEGADAIINIITKKSRYNGSNGTVKALVRNFNRDFNADIKVRRNSFSYSLDIGAYFNNFKWTEKILRDDLNAQRPARLFQQTNIHNKYWSYYAGLNIIKVLDSLKTFTAGYRFRKGELNSTRSVYNNYTIKDLTPLPYYRNISMFNANMGYAINMGYTAKSANKKNELNILGVFFDYDGQDDYDLDQARNEITDHKEISRGIMDNRELSLQVDDVFKLKEKSSIEAGARATFRYFSFDNEIKIFDFSNADYIKDQARSNDFSYRRAIYAAYLNYSFAIKKWEFLIGARYEQTTLLADFADTSLTIPNYKNLAPNFLISRKIDENNSIRFSYRKTILRPYLQNLDPNIIYMDSLNIRYGNPYLLPALQHGFQLVHSFTKGSYVWSNTVFLNRNINGVENIRTLRPDGILESTYQNVGKFMDAGIITSLVLNRETDFSFNISCNLRYVNTKSEALNLYNNGFTYGVNINVAYRLDKSFAIEASTRLNSRTIYLQGSETKWIQSGISVTKKLFNDKLNITVGTDDFFFKYQTIKSVTRSAKLDQHSEYRYPSRIFRLGISYALGKKDLSLPQTRQSVSEE
ncbi:MAG TPA: outer membrane beta-barrel protein [Flavitalea sp.]|nr:outer membrane beta-barrel protein [Flavitalea sp.]